MRDAAGVRDIVQRNELPSYHVALTFPSDCEARVRTPAQGTAAPIAASGPSSFSLQASSPLPPQRLATPPLGARLEPPLTAGGVRPAGGRFTAAGGNPLLCSAFHHTAPKAEHQQPQSVKTCPHLSPVCPQFIRTTCLIFVREIGLVPMSPRPQSSFEKNKTQSNKRGYWGQVSYSSGSNPFGEIHSRPFATMPSSARAENCTGRKPRRRRRSRASAWVVRAP